MALIPKSEYRGQITGKREMTEQEKRRYGKTTYAPGVRRKVASDGKVVILVTWEYKAPNAKKWEPAEFNGKSPDGQWNFKSITAAAEYITKYMNKKGAKPNNKQGKEYFVSYNGYWVKGEIVNPRTNRKEETWIFKLYDNPQWDNGATLFSQWIIEGKRYLYRITFEQIKEVVFTGRDYHDPEPNPWTHQGTRTSTTPATSYYRDEMKGKVRIIDTINKVFVPQRASSYSVRTYRGEDPHDTTEQQRRARKKFKATIEKEYRSLSDHVKYPLTQLEQQMEKEEHELYRPTKGDKTAWKWLRKIRKTNPTWLQYAANARSLAEYCVKYLKQETMNISQADKFCEQKAKYI